MAEMPKRSKGRQRIEMEKIKNEANLLVTFSKRHQSIYRKAHELNSLTGAKVAIIGFSPKNKPFSFGCPNVPSILGKYQNPGPLIYNAPADSLVELGDIANLKQCNDEIMFFEDKLRREMKCGEAIDAKIKGRENHWWEVPTVELDLEQAEKLKMDLMSLQTLVSNAPHNPQVPDRLLDCYVPNIDFVTPQYAAALPSSINGGIFTGGTPSSIGAECSSNPMAHLNPMAIESATAGVLQHAGPSIINPNVQRVLGECGSIGLHYDPMASGSSSNWYDHGFDLEDSEFYKLCCG